MEYITATICKIKDCSNISNIEYLRGMCQKHYRKWCKSDKFDGRVRHWLSNVDKINKVGECCRCGVVSLVGTIGHLQCINSARQSEFKRNLKRRYDLTVEEFALMKDNQGGLCAGGCGRIAKCVDHDHKTDAIRELLCSPCNQALGMINDSPEQLERLALYLRKHGKDG